MTIDPLLCPPSELFHNAHPLVKDYKFLGVHFDWSKGKNEDWSAADDPIYSYFDKFYDSEETILEIGSGNGGSFERCYNSVSSDKVKIKKAFLTDINANTTKHLNKTWVQSNPFGIDIEAHVTDGLSLPMIDDESVDFVFSIHSLRSSCCSCSLSIMEKIMSEVKRVLKPKGKYLIQTWGYIPYEEKIWWVDILKTSKRTDGEVTKYDDIHFGYRETIDMNFFDERKKCNENGPRISN